MAKNTICLWYDKDAEAAARFYAETFPDSTVGAIHRAPSDYPSGKKGDVLIVEFKVAGVSCVGLNGVPRSNITKPSRSRSPLTINPRPTAIWDMAAMERSILLPMSTLDLLVVGLVIILLMMRRTGFIRRRQEKIY